MKKILSLFTLLVGFVCGAWAADVRVTALSELVAGTKICLKVNVSGQNNGWFGMPNGSQTTPIYFTIVDGNANGTIRLKKSDTEWIGYNSTTYVAASAATDLYIEKDGDKFIFKNDAGTTTATYGFTMENKPELPATWWTRGGAARLRMEVYKQMEEGPAPEGSILPEAGKTYYIASDNRTAQYYLHFNGTGLGLNATKEVDPAFMWTCAVSGTYYTFRNVASGKYLAHKTVQNDPYNFTIDATKAITEGCLPLYAVKDNRYMLVKNDGTAFDQATVPFNKNTTNFSSDYVFAECDPSSLYYSASYESAVWLRVANSSNTNYFMTVKADDKAGSLLHTATGNAGDAGQLFALVGNNETGFVVYSKLLGERFTLTASGTDNGAGATWAENAAAPTKWFLVDTYVGAAQQPGYSFTTSKTSGTGLNMYGGAGGDVKYYTAGANNGGSRWMMSLVDGTPSVIHYVVNGEKKYNDANLWLGQLKLQKGSYASTTYVEPAVGGTTFEAYLPKSSDALTISNSPLHGWKCDITENAGEYTVTYTADQETEYQYLAFDKSAQWYRIPAIASANNGDLVAIYDYRVCHNDVGFGEVDQHMRRSSDYGKTWTAETKIADGKGGGKVFGAAFGDPALVADRESGKMTLITVSGTTVYTYATDTDHNLVSVQHSDDNGATWSEPRDITSQFWGAAGALLADGATQAESNVFAYSGFFGSGRILQSRTVKVGQYYRIYAAMLCQGHNVKGAYVVYSDDLGDTWHLLGGDNTVQAAPDSNEPKVEELPGGDVVLSCRKYNGRYFNIWHWTSLPTTASPEGQGQWGTVVDTNNTNQCSNGIRVGGNSCNGEILIVDVKKADGTAATLALQSLPSGNDRSGVEIWYKDVTDPATYADVRTFASNWTRGLRVSPQSPEQFSAYSTMVLQEDGRLGFFYEEGPATYCMVYVPLTIEKVTDNAYQGIVPEMPTAEYIDAAAALKNAYAERASVQLGEGWLDYVAVGSEDLDDLLAEAQPYTTKSVIALYNQPVALATLTDLAQRLAAIRIVQNYRKGCFVRLQGYSGNYVSMPASGTNAKMTATADKTTILYLSPEGELINFATGLGLYQTSIVAPVDGTLCKYTLAASGREGKYFLQSNATGMGTYLYDNTANGTKLDRNSSPVNNGNYQTDWTIIEVTELPIGINASGYATFNSPVQMKAGDDVKAYTVALNMDDAAQPTVTLTLLEDGIIPANTAVILKGDGAVTLTADHSPVAAGISSDLQGTVAAKAISQTLTTVADAYYYVLSDGIFKYATGTKINGFKGYLHINLPYAGAAQSGLRMILPEEGLATGIEASDVLPANVAIYDLQGRRATGTQRGMYIVNGKKVLR